MQQVVLRVDFHSTPAPGTGGGARQGGSWHAVSERDRQLPV